MPWSAFTSRKQSPFSSLGSVLLTHPASPWGRATQQVHTKTFSHPSLSLSLSLSLSEIGGLVLVFGLSFSPGGIPWGDPPSLGVIPGDHPRRSPQGTPPKDPRRGSPRGPSLFRLPIFCFVSEAIPPEDPPQGIPPAHTLRGSTRGSPPGDRGFPQGTPSAYSAYPLPRLFPKQATKYIDV